MKTPGYNARIAIFFDTDRLGRVIAYRWSPLQLRAFRIGLNEAKHLVAQDLADLLDEHPMKRYRKVV